MVVIPVVWLHYEPETIRRGYWDQGMLEDLFANRMWRTGYEFEHHESIKEVDGAVVVLPARAQVRFAERLNADLSHLNWVILILTGDEEAVFPIEEISHPNMRVWVMSPRHERHNDYTPLGTGYPPQLHQLMPERPPEKTLDWFFAGQVTHERRIACAQQLDHLDNGESHPSPGFTQGLPPDQYMAKLAAAKVAPCPSGPCTPDSFRLFEALEAGCVPIADSLAPSGEFPDYYWSWFFKGKPPFPTLTDYNDLPMQIHSAVAQYPELNNRVFAWWQRKKYEMAQTLATQIEMLSGQLRDIGMITVLMPTSPTVNHPSTAITEETVHNIRVQLPEAEIFLMFDGVRPESEHLRGRYEEYQRRVLWLCNYKWDNVLPLRFEEFGHQSTMTPKALNLVKTPLILFAEHDTPLVPDWPIEWDGLIAAIMSGEANVIRFHHEAHVLPEHEYLMLGGVKEVEGVKMRRTYQWSQRPHLADAEWYHRMLERVFRPEAKAFIEHGAYGDLVVLWDSKGIEGWREYKLWLYHPDGVILRSYNLNGRGEGRNFDSEF